MYEIYIGGLVLAYLAAYAVAMRLQTGKAALFGACVWIFCGFVAGPIVLSARSTLPQHGLGEAIADFALMLITIVAGVLAFAAQGARLGPLNAPDRLRRMVAWIALPLAPMLAAGLVIGVLRLLYAN